MEAADELGAAANVDKIIIMYLSRGCFIAHVIVCLIIRFQSKRGSLNPSAGIQGKPVGNDLILHGKPQVGPEDKSGY